MRSRRSCTLVAETNSCRSVSRPYRVEIDEALDQVLERIDVERIDIVGRQDIATSHRTRRRSAMPSSGRNENRRSSALRCSSGRSPPRLAARQKSASRLRASSGPPRASPSASMHGIDRAGRRAGNALDLEPPVLEQMIEHAPGEGAVGAAALQRQIDALGALAACRFLSPPKARDRNSIMRSLLRDPAAVDRIGRAGDAGGAASLAQEHRERADVLPAW